MGSLGLVRQDGLCWRVAYRSASPCPTRTRTRRKCGAGRLWPSWVLRRRSPTRRRPSCGWTPAPTPEHDRRLARTAVGVADLTGAIIRGRTSARSAAAQSRTATTTRTPRTSQRLPPVVSTDRCKMTAAALSSMFVPTPSGVREIAARGHQAIFRAPPALRRQSCHPRGAAAGGQQPVRSATAYAMNRSLVPRSV